MKDFIKSMVLTFVICVVVYFAVMFFINSAMWLVTDESEQVYQPVWNIFNL